MIRSTELIPGYDRAILRIGGNPMDTVWIDAEEARALLADLAAWLEVAHADAK